MADATHRAVRDVLNHGLRGDLIASAVGVELGAQLQSAITSDTGDGATPTDILQALRDACDQDPVAYARLLELTSEPGTPNRDRVDASLAWARDQLGVGESKCDRASTTAATARRAGTDRSRRRGGTRASSPENCGGLGMERTRKAESRPTATDDDCGESSISSGERLPTSATDTDGHRFPDKEEVPGSNPGSPIVVWDADGLRHAGRRPLAMSC